MDTSISDRRYGFGRNWSRYLKSIDTESTAIAKDSLIRNFGRESFAGCTFLDIGSGSGLFSLAAHELGATVRSFDYDRDSVACTVALRGRSTASATSWIVEQGSILDDSYVSRLGTFDLVYSWGVLHHTGSMWQAIDNALRLVAPTGRVLIALYNDQGWRSRYWAFIKSHYNAGALRRAAIVASHVPPLFAFWLGGNLRRLFRGEARRPRGMRFLTDALDWLGGHPFAVATPVDFIAHAERRGFRVVRVHTVGDRIGCNEYLLERGEGDRVSTGDGSSALLS